MRVIIVILVIAELSLAMAETGTGSGTFNLINLGSVDGKNYFYDKTRRTWQASRDFCIESGMELATIETPKQAEFLKSKYNYSTFSGFYKLGGRDALLARQFTWDSSGTAATDIVGLNWRVDPGYSEYLTCVSYYSNIIPVFNIVGCEVESFVLCQT
ncbi:unnamed protein product [Orchesella dallaii]|uniref:C-type lectin domain-containing protein n=1 Tax=Orchesella dallaii TaxID=48710 RepID=A0ABP1S1Q4_9HEXA